MIKKVLLLLVCFQLVSCDPAALQRTLDALGSAELSTSEVSSGLKQALEIGIGKGSETLSRKDGYFKSAYKILLPPEAQKVADKLRNVPGFSNVENQILEKINRGAEDAAKKAKPIFVDAIRQMSFSDAMNILMGEQNAATSYLNRTTSDNLYTAFNPVIVQSLDKFDARKYWSDAVNAYNKIPFVDKANPDLDDYVTKQALNGLFSMVENEELNIRTNIASRTTDLLKKVFAKQDKK
ncbi:MAG: DUF4197 domain-containing protein [Saprospiraceae bacterium]|nr:DUF4197 domain-containing protein [Saprospiraceae bacterium]MCF8249074.1 DUF4197 domain-containing protein [Saprospiraceae bacterium]MCF8280941.1 DUF4197 domain-containing protein [Bacteroidales bacterium]MCF8311096.1 DUF4197 domain-containing protein [Saprospiraceae bacterium]MCF8440186.1 DUF4197 domain-containing protein [Saprospiraceae bacterium]